MGGNSYSWIYCGLTLICWLVDFLIFGLSWAEQSVSPCVQLLS